MGIGPFTTYSPPGGTTQTVADPIVGQLLQGLLQCLKGRSDLNYD